VKPSGFCRSGAEAMVANICLHMGEEPVIIGDSGACNVFFSHCNLQCIFCQNHQISNNAVVNNGQPMTCEQIAERIIPHLEKGCKTLGFVSPAHFSPHIKGVMKALENRGHQPIVVYNSNGYDQVDVLKKLEDTVGIYLPDLKYASAETAMEYSACGDYPQKAKAAIKEMYRQKGSTLRMLDEHYAESGLIVRHLVLPGHAAESIELLEWLADECSPLIHLSLMCQYTPAYKACSHDILCNTLQKEEYEMVCRAAENLGFCRGWTQAFTSIGHYIPDFDQQQPFQD
jgi:putative pyruvate formate lyase activating enzyme